MILFTIVPLMLLALPVGAVINGLFEPFGKEVLEPLGDKLEEFFKSALRRFWERLRDIITSREPEAPTPREVSV